MDIHLDVRDEHDETYTVGHMLCPVVPRIGETVYLRMSLGAKFGNSEWRINPASPITFNTAYFLVEDVDYDGYNVEEIEEGMGSAPLHEGSTAYTVTLYVRAKNEDTQVYIDRIIKNGKADAEE